MMGWKFVSEVLWFTSCFVKDGGREGKYERSGHKAQKKKMQRKMEFRLN